MTLFAGAFGLTAGTVLPASLRESLLQHLRAPDAPQRGQLRSHEREGFFLTGWDSGAFADPAWKEAPGALCVLAGDPLLTDAGSRLTRGQQIDGIAPPGQPPRADALSRCRGSFALVFHDSANGILHLATDAIGLRSVYYVAQDGILIFATALRILEAMPEVRKRISRTGMAELHAFSFPLAERTPFNGIHVLRESQMLRADAQGIQLSNYHDWADDATSFPNPDAAAQGLYAAFNDAVRLRAGRDNSVYSFLSGGMDSRAIVAALIDSGRTIEALNFSADGSQDRIFAQQLVAELPRQCRLHCLQGGSFPNFSFLALAAKTELEKRESVQVDRPQCIWSGDGGSVGLGHVYMDETMVDIAERDGIEAAVDYFFEFNKIALPYRALNLRSRRELPRQLRQTVIDEMNLYPRLDLGRRAYLFLLFNDQRRHLFKHFETIDRHGLELLMPFYDAEFLKLITSVPARWGILHRLYATWFDHFPQFARRTPWQTYPGHVPCPVPASVTASYQWAKHDNSAKCASLAERIKLAMRVITAFSYGATPQIYSMERVWLVALLHAMGVGDAHHLLAMLQVYRRHEVLTTK